MKKYLSVTLVFTLLLSGCSSEQGNVANDENTDQANVENHKDAGAINPNAVAVVDISGMVCLMGCGADIRKNLEATGAVAACDFDFEDGRKINTASIKFDKTKISETKIKNIIETINDHQFTVSNSSLKDIDSPSSTEVDEDATSGGVETSSISMSQKTWKFPNLLDLISSVVM